MHINAAVLESFFTRLDFTFQNAQKTVPTFYKQIATETPSITEANVYPFLSMIPGLREWIGPRQVRNVAARGFTVVNKHWELTEAIDVDKFNDDTYGFYAQLMPMVAQQVAEFKDRRLAAVIEANTACWDGQNFFDTAHPVDPDRSSLGTQSNKLVGSGYDISGNSGDPLVAYGAAKAAMALWKREDGQQLGVIPDTIMVHPNEEKYALQLAKAITTAQQINSNSGAGVSNVFAGSLNVLVNPYLTVTSGKPWYLLCTKRGIMPFLWQTRQEAQIVSRTALTDQNVWSLRQFEYGADLRGEASYTFPFLAFRMSAS